LLISCVYFRGNVSKVEKGDKKEKKMAAEAPIITRYLRLRKQVCKNTNFCLILRPTTANYKVAYILTYYFFCQVLEPSEAGLTFEGLIDALLVLYEECSSDKLKKGCDSIEQNFF
jgi:hypothetical protein